MLMDRYRSLHFQRRHLVIAFISTKLFGNAVYTVRHGLVAGMRRKGGLGFLPFKEPETAEVHFLRELLLDGKVVYDIGAFEGILTMFFARRAKQVIAYEPNPRNYRRCLENIALNKLSNVTVVNRGISDRAGSIEMAYDPLMPGAASADSAIASLISRSVRSAQRLRIGVTRLDDDIDLNKRPAPDVIKMDVEGMEYEALQGMERTLGHGHPAPALYIELHGATVKEKTETAQMVIGLLERRGYKIRDVEHGDYLTRASLGDRRPAHIYCTM
jgi:FkbM family methyltransferase